MTDSITPAPDSCGTITPYLAIRGAAAAMTFYRDVFGATETMRFNRPDGLIGHAEMVIGNARIMLCDEAPQMGAVAPPSLGGSPVTLFLYVEDVDAVAARAIAAGADLRQPIEDRFWGDRSGTLVDPCGHVWHIATHIEDVPAEEVQRRAAAQMTQCGGGS